MRELLKKFRKGLLLILLPVFWTQCVPEEQLSITLDKTTVELFVGEEMQLQAKLVHSSKDQVPLVWTSSNEQVLSVRDGLITAKKAGTATIVVTADYVSAKCQVTVKNVEVAGITLNQTLVTLKIGDQLALEATLTPSNATDKSISWSSSNTDIATVDNGRIVALKEGTVTITAKAGSQSATCKVTVEKIEVAEIIITPDILELTEEDTYQLNATVLPENATDQTVTWSSDAPTVVTVDAEGKITALKAGNAIITAKAGLKNATCTVKVSSKVIEVTGEHQKTK